MYFPEVINLFFTIFIFLPVFGAIGYALFEVTVEMFKRRPWKDVMYGKTMVSDAIAKAVLGEDFESRKTQLMRPPIKASQGLNSVEIMNLSQEDWETLVEVSRKVDRNSP